MRGHAINNISGLKILMEMFTCSGSSSGPRIFSFGTTGSDIRSLWKRQENCLTCVGKLFSLTILHLLNGFFQFCILNKRFNWQCYNFEKYGLPVEKPPNGKLLLYPIQVIWLLCYGCDNLRIISQVNTEGELTNLEMFETFPDYNETAKVLGGRTGVIPEKLTT